MKQLLFIPFIALGVSNSVAQNYLAQLEQMDAELTQEGNVIVVHTLGEPVPGIDVIDGVTVIQGFYPAHIFEGPSGTSTIQPIEGLSVFPIPTRDKITLNYPSSSHPFFNISMVDADGRKLLDTEWNESVQFEIACSSLTPGTYFLSISDPSANRRSSFRVIVH